ncbi:glycosyltransferase [Flagellimonas sp. 389]|uniref:glycosyltransferase family 2 protein n=1 Tax=Flagellimonas sp. 389 TaxID=2835862 RepID=UPI001BD1C918|nr:glycosyltransferase [Flagellimonas sp. 389]MBS9462198.1 glycosyltransferase [Flagellimonas sp. 389]
MTPILSIVIPVYNVSAYVEKCIRSCFDQSVGSEEFEVIVVDDGGTDNSLQICKGLLNDFPSMKIISQKNKGLSGARNTGLNHAKGNYVWFVDSDDWISSNCLKDIFHKLRSNSLDILWLGHDVIYNDKVTRQYIPTALEKPIYGETLFIDYLNNLFYIWKFIYKRSFLEENQLFFYEGILYEDLEFTPRALLKAKHCDTLPKAYYHYLMREGSIINSISTKNVEDRFLILNALHELKNEKNVSNKYKETLEKTIIHFFAGSVKMAARAKLPLPKTAYSIIKKIKKKYGSSKNGNKDFKLMAISLKTYHKTYSSIYNLYKKVS